LLAAAAKPTSRFFGFYLMVAIGRGRFAMQVQRGRAAVRRSTTNSRSAARPKAKAKATPKATAKATPKAKAKAKAKATEYAYGNFMGFIAPGDQSSTLMRPLEKPEWMTDEYATTKILIDLDVTHCSKIVLCTNRLQVYHGYSPSILLPDRRHLYECRNVNGHIDFYPSPEDHPSVGSYNTSNRMN
jgi:hypothetical protein